MNGLNDMHYIDDYQHYDMSEEYDVDPLYPLQQDDYAYYDDHYDLETLLREKLETFSFTYEWINITTNCLGSIALQSFHQIKIILLMCLSFRLLVYTSHSYLLFLPGAIRMNLLHAIGGITGLAVLHNLNYENFSSTLYIVIPYLIITYTVLYILHHVPGKLGITVSLLTVLYIFSAELLIGNPRLWHQIRGIILLLSMKIISLGFDLDRKVETNIPNLIVFFGYCLHCGTLLFGPWVSLGCYSESVSNPKNVSLSWAYYVVQSLFIAFICLLLSTCVFSYLFIDAFEPQMPALVPLVAGNWMLSYKNAISFHFSHFYICYLAQAACMLSGIGRRGLTGVRTWSEFVITKPLQVEIPTSMLNVVVAWNIPMSGWLKNYIFNTYRYMGRSTAILLTYTASAILHGLSFHLAAVLLSLAFYTYVEYELRMKLSKTFNCPSIQARQKSNERGRQLPAWAYLFKFLWILINLMHLAYLGSMFQSDDQDVESEGYPMKHTLDKWSNLGFFSHIFASICLIINYLL